MAGSFDDRIAELAERVGRGDLVGSVVVDQVYAKIQELALDFKHPGGGQAKYLETALLSTADQNCQTLADAVLDGDLGQAMTESVERIAGQVEKLAPVDLGNLRESGHPSVTDEGVTVYDRPPVQRRLTEAELRAMHQGH